MGVVRVLAIVSEACRNLCSLDLFSVHLLIFYLHTISHVSTTSWISGHREAHVWWTCVACSSHYSECVCNIAPLSRSPTILVMLQRMTLMETPKVEYLLFWNLKRYRKFKTFREPESRKSHAVQLPFVHFFALMTACRSQCSTLSPFGPQDWNQFARLGSKLLYTLIPITSPADECVAMDETRYWVGGGGNYQNTLCILLKFSLFSLFHDFIFLIYFPIFLLLEKIF